MKSGLLRRNRAQPVDPDAPVADDAPTRVEAVPAPDAAPARPAGLGPEELIGERPDTRRRGRLRRRLRHLRQVRELMLRDVGGLVYEVHRAGGDGAGLVAGKLERLEVLDAERRELEAALGDARPGTVLREPGVGGTCPVCEAYFATDAHFCSNCGTRVDGRAPAEPVEAEPVTAGEHSL